MATIFDAVLGRVYLDGVELELGAGVNFTSGLLATRSATGAIDVTPHAAAIVRASYDYAGSATALPASTATALCLDGAATSIALSGIVALGSAVEVTARIWTSPESGTSIRLDELRFVLYQETVSSEIHIVSTTTGTSSVGTGARTLTLAGPCSTDDWIVGASYGGSLSITSDVSIGSVRNATVLLQVGQPWIVPVVVS